MKSINQLPFPSREEDTQRHEKTQFDQIVQILSLGSVITPVLTVIEGLHHHFFHCRGTMMHRLSYSSIMSVIMWVMVYLVKYKQSKAALRHSGTVLLVSYIGLLCEYTIFREPDQFKMSPVQAISEYNFNYRLLSFVAAQEYVNLILGYSKEMKTKQRWSLWAYYVVRNIQYYRMKYTYSIQDLQTILTHFSLFKQLSQSLSKNFLRRFYTDTWIAFGDKTQIKVNYLLIHFTQYPMESCQLTLPRSKLPLLTKKWRKYQETASILTNTLKRNVSICSSQKLLNLYTMIKSHLARQFQTQQLKSHNHKDRASKTALIAFLIVESQAIYHLFFLLRQIVQNFH
ncbi:hypothetical protein FGO68_gene10865 [Halteria grandinella]|uniref:Uncharacterized protein n=1 Tax=Halteria grandinella TaxID=5974 RepID=A0A8J8T6I3_HALGN|nr:hypothetical protein FGO68_gene10865 [Halteria grandinella]